MAPTNPSHPISEMIAAEAPRYLAVIDQILAMDYLQPDLRRRVIRLQRQLIQIELGAHYPAEDEAKTASQPQLRYRG